MAEEREVIELVKTHFEPSNYTVFLAFRVVKSDQASSRTVARSSKRRTSKPRILSVTAKLSAATEKFKVRLQVLKQTAAGKVQTVSIYNLKHLSKVEVVASDKSDCTLVLDFDDLEAQTSQPPQWTMRNIDDRNQFVSGILKLCRQNLGRVPKTVGIDVVEIALWEQENSTSFPTEESGEEPAQSSAQGGAEGCVNGSICTSDWIGREIVSKAEEDNMDTLLDYYDFGLDDAQEFSERLNQELTALEAANVHDILETVSLLDESRRPLLAALDIVEDLDEWLRVFNVKLQYIGYDIKSIQTRSSGWEIQLENNRGLMIELDKLLEKLALPSKYKSLLTSGPFEEANMANNVEASEWLVGALRSLQPPILDPVYVNMRVVREKRAELENLKIPFVRRASHFLTNHFAQAVDSMLKDKSHFSQKGQLRIPDHSDLRFKCNSYAGVLPQIKNLDFNALKDLRKSYCSSVNLLVRREAREFVNELRSQIKVFKTPGSWLEAGLEVSGGSSSGHSTSRSSDAYGYMLEIFIPFLVDESSFFESLMCFEVSPAAPRPSADENDGNGSDRNQDQIYAEPQTLIHDIRELFDGVEEDFYAMVDQNSKADPLRCISMQGLTEQYLGSHKVEAAPEAAGFVPRLLMALQARINLQFNKFVEEENHQIERYEKRVRQAGVLSYVSRFAALAHKMENLTLQFLSRDMVDLAYKRLVDTMFAVLNRVAQIDPGSDPRQADVILLGNYAAFWNSIFDLAKEVESLRPYIHQASEAYEDASASYVKKIINLKFENIIQFTKQVDNLLLTLAPEEVPFQMHVSRQDLRTAIHMDPRAVRKSLKEMHNIMQKDLASFEDIFPSIWEKFKEDFMDKYEDLNDLIIQCYPSEKLSPSCEEVKELLKNVENLPKHI